MRACALVLLAALGGCRGGNPFARFDGGHPVHVIVKPEPRPRRPIRLRPTSTLGAQVYKTEPIAVGGKGTRAVEVATFLAPTGKHRFSIWEPRTWTDARATVDIAAETWIVLEIQPLERVGKLEVFDAPPDEDIGPWQPLVPVPD